ncbi:MAG TPA: hypothetical protein VM925_21810 [Labilithrix sp.]|nr:hypothetical protein [Labilithrix sp.]
MSETTRDCPNCGATNSAKYTFCHHCRLTPTDCKAAASGAATPKRTAKTSAAKKRSK